MLPNYFSLLVNQLGWSQIGSWMCSICSPMYVVVSCIATIMSPCPYWSTGKPFSTHICSSCPPPTHQLWHHDPVGLDWHLIIHDLKLSHICAGPSNDVFENRDMIHSDSGVGLWDHTLSKDELNLICGVYKV
jgi:hypothetical protein